MRCSDVETPETRLPLAQVKRPTAEIFDVVRKICPKEDIGQANVG